MLVVVGGHSRRVGKTAVVAGLIRALPQADWTAVKITPHAHSASAVHEETDPGRPRDTSRYLAAGARRAILFSSTMPGWRDALRTVLETAQNAILESNSVLEFLRPDLFLLVVDDSVPEFKPSARTALGLADALVVVDRGQPESLWAGAELGSKPRFRVQPPAYSSAELAEFVQSRMG